MKDFRQNTFSAKSHCPDVRGIEKAVTNNKGRNLTGVHQATMCGKMASRVIDGEKVTMKSISTSINENTRCQERIAAAIANNDLDCICLYCFSNEAVNDGSKRGAGMLRNCTKNHKILTNGFLNWSRLPVIRTNFFRFESHADIQNIIQGINYIMFIEKSNEAGEHVHFGVWTKNADIWSTIFNDMRIRKPDNLMFHMSSCHTNKRDMVPAEYWFVDDVFTVWNDEKTANENGVELTCCRPGYHPHCVECRRCYRDGNDTNEVMYTDELLRTK